MKTFRAGVAPQSTSFTQLTVEHDGAIQHGKKKKKKRLFNDP
jgi:hypothetical protein